MIQSLADKGGATLSPDIGFKIFARPTGKVLCYSGPETHFENCEEPTRIRFVQLLKHTGYLVAFVLCSGCLLLWVFTGSAVPFSIVFYLVLISTCANINRGNFALGPSGIHAAYFSLYIFIPAVFLYALQPPLQQVGQGNEIFIGNQCMAAICLGMAGFIVGALLVGKGKPEEIALRDNVGTPGQRIALYGLIFGALLLTAAFMANNASGMLTMVLGSFSNHYAEVQEFKTLALYGSNWLLQGMNQIIPIAILFLLTRGYVRAKPSRGARFLIVLAVGFQFLTGGLWVGFSIIVMVIMLRSYFVPESRQKTLRYGLGLMLVVTVALALKYGLSSDSGDSGFLIFSALHRFTAGARQLQFVLEREHSYQFGFTYIRDVIAMIPSPIKRPLFAEQYWGGFNGLMFYKMYGFYGGTAQVPLIGESFVNGGMLWVFLFSVVHGAAVQKASNFLRHRQGRTTFGVVASVVIGYRLGECVVEGIGTRLFVSALWLLIFYAVVRVFGTIIEYSLSLEQTQASKI